MFDLSKITKILKPSEYLKGGYLDYRFDDLHVKVFYDNTIRVTISLETDNGQIYIQTNDHVWPAAQNLTNQQITKIYDKIKELEDNP